MRESKAKVELSPGALALVMLQPLNSVEPLRLVAVQTESVGATNSLPLHVGLVGL